MHPQTPATTRAREARWTRHPPAARPQPQPPRWHHIGDLEATRTRRRYRVSVSTLAGVDSMDCGDSDVHDDGDCDRDRRSRRVACCEECLSTLRDEASMANAARCSLSSLCLRSRIHDSVLRSCWICTIPTSTARTARTVGSGREARRPKGQSSLPHLIVQALGLLVQ